MSEEMQLSAGTNKLLDELSSRSGKTKGEIIELCLYESLQGEQETKQEGIGDYLPRPFKESPITGFQKSLKLPQKLVEELGSSMDSTKDSIAKRRLRASLGSEIGGLKDEILDDLRNELKSSILRDLRRELKE